jgi:hypothetical protein
MTWIECPTATITMDSPEQRYEQIREFLQEATLRDYPNPARRGCGGSEVLRKLAAGSLPRGADWDHVTHCSPCYRDFLQFRAEFLEGERQRRKRIRSRVVVAAIVLGGGIVTYWEVHERNQAVVTEKRYQITQQSPAVSLLLRPGLSRSIATSVGKQILVLPAKPTLVRLLLHLEDDTASLYDVVIQTVEGRDLLRFTSLPKQLLAEHDPVVALDIQSASVKPGPYVLLLFDHDPAELRNVYNLLVVQ